MNTFSIVEFDYRNTKQIEAISSIHQDVLPDSFVVKMGNLFMKKFYYRTLPKLGYLKCFLAKLDDRYVGIIVTNKKPFSLIRSALPTNFFSIGWIIFLSIILDPRRLAVLVDLLRYKPDPLLKQYEDTGEFFEILTIGVVKEHRNLVLTNGQKISHVLLHHAVAYYNALKFNRITGQILKENKSALGFYAKYSAEFVQSSVREHGVILNLPIEKIVVSR
jgi:hypothetical protein